jgi:hypothetical protein
MKDEFDKAYDEADEEEWWREKNFKNIRWFVHRFRIMGPVFICPEMNKK